MSAIDEAREYLSAKHRIYSSGETKAIVRGLLRYIEAIELVERKAVERIEQLSDRQPRD